MTELSTLTGTNAALPAFLATQVGRHSVPWVVTADLVGPLGLTPYFVAHPERTIDVGIAEQAAVALSAGIAAANHDGVIVALFAPFFLRAFDQIRNLLDLDNRSVVLVATHAGIATGSNGHSHHGVEDIGVMRTLRNVTIWSPGSHEEAVQVLSDAVNHGGLHYVRLTRSLPVVDFCRSDDLSDAVTDELKCTVIGHGSMSGVARATAQALRHAGANADYVGVNQLHPVPSEILALARDPSMLVVIEDHYANCGFAAALGSELALTGIPRQVRAFGLREPMTSDDADVLWESAGLTVEAIVRGILKPDLDNR